MQQSTWLQQAIQIIEADIQRSADTHLIKLDMPQFSGIDIYLKDESTHPTGSLKHRLARSLFLYGLCNGWIKQNTPIIEASSGSTAISEAYFARLLGLPFIAVMAIIWISLLMPSAQQIGAAITTLPILFFNKCSWSHTRNQAIL